MQLNRYTIRYLFTISAFLLKLLCNPVIYILAHGQCFNLEREMAYCAQKHNVHIPNNPRIGYNFGYGSLNDTEYMCK